jgi:hypothetical protein
MALPEVVTHEQWLEARKRLLAAEKEETRRRDALSAERRRLPMVRIEKEAGRSPGTPPMTATSTTTSRPPWLRRRCRA